MSSRINIFWFRSDLRLSDNPGLSSACDSGAAVVPVYILDDVSAGAWKRGAASRWWLHQSLKSLDADLKKSGFHPLVLLNGDAAVEIEKLCGDISVQGVYWNRCYEPHAMKRDEAIKSALKQKGIEVESFNGSMIYEPWEIKNKTGDQYKVFTPFSRAFLERGGIRKALPRPKGKMPAQTVRGLGLDDLGLMPPIKWYAEMAQSWTPGEDGARERLSDFASDGAGAYKTQRDYPERDGVSRFSPHLHFGEISPVQVWHAVSDAALRSGRADVDASAQAFLRQLIWREFSWHLLYHDHSFPDQPWNKSFVHFPWRRDDDALKKWQRGMTGYPIVDAGMRQLWRTGWMHNRVRMIVGSFLVKNLLLDWRAGEKWFWDTLVDADLGNNAAGWQWIAGCGADAAPYFRVFNPVLQSRKFDAEGSYIRAYVPEIAGLPDEYLHAPWEAPPMVLAAAGMTLGKTYPMPIVDPAGSRDRALEAYAEMKSLKEAS